MLYTRKGDTGTTKILNCDQRISKSSKISEALGTVDELNSFLGLVKTIDPTMTVMGYRVSPLILDIQQDLFVVQAELAGSDKKVTDTMVLGIEKLIDGFEKLLPPITSFFVSGGTKLAASCDVARTIARRAERRVVEALEENETKEVHADLLRYMNRLSSLLYALARIVNSSNGITEIKPDYNEK